MLIYPTELCTEAQELVYTLLYVPLELRNHGHARTVKRDEGPPRSAGSTRLQEPHGTP